MRGRSWRNSYRFNSKSRGQEDYEQVQRILHGEEGCWEQLYQNAYPIVRSFARQNDWKCLLLSQDYDDITDEAFARCYGNLERYRGESRFSTWVCGYAKNITRNRCSRQHTRLRNKGHLEDLARNQMATCDPYLVLLRCERDNCLWRAFYDLDEMEQEIVIRRVFKDDAPRLIAKDLNLTRKEVLHRFEHAKVTMRQLYLYYYNHINIERE